MFQFFYVLLCTFAIFLSLMPAIGLSEKKITHECKEKILLKALQMLHDKSLKNFLLLLASRKNGGISFKNMDYLPLTFTYDQSANTCKNIFFKILLEIM